MSFSAPHACPEHHRARPSPKIVPRPCLQLVTVRKGYVRLPSKSVPAGDPVKAPAGNVGYARSGPHHEDGTARVTDDPIGDALEGERLFSPPPQMLRKAASGERYFERTENLNVAVVPILYGGELAGGVVFATRQWEAVVYEPFLRSGLEAAVLALLHAPKHFAGHLIAQNPPDEALGERSSSGPATSPSPRPRR